MQSSSPTPAFVQSVIVLRPPCHWTRTSSVAPASRNRCSSSRFTCHLRPSFSNRNYRYLNSQSSNASKNKQSSSSSSSSPSSPSTAPQYNSNQSNPSFPSSSLESAAPAPVPLHPQSLLMRPHQPEQQPDLTEITLISSPTTKRTDRAQQPEQHQPQQQRLEWFFTKLLRPTRLAFATVGFLLGTVGGQFTQMSPSQTSSLRTCGPHFRVAQSVHARSSSSKTQDQKTSSSSVRYNGKQELDSREKAMSLMLTGGTFAALGVWAWKQNRRDDELEEVRIKDEVERLEKLRAEFLDVDEDDDSLDDEDLLASLKQRLSEDEADDPDKSDSDESGDTVTISSDDQQTDDDGQQTSTEKGSIKAEDSSSVTDSSKSGLSNGTSGGDDSAKNSQENPAAADADSVDMLRRMWEATDDDSKKEKDNKQ